MEPLSDSPETELVRRSFDALTRGDYAVLESSLSEDARWRTVEEGATNCEGRATIIAMMHRNLGGRSRGAIEEASLSGSRVIVGLRPEQQADAAGRPLERGIAWMALTIADGQITELKGRADRAAAVAYAKPGRGLGADRFDGPAPSIFRSTDYGRTTMPTAPRMDA